MVCYVVYEKGLPSLTSVRHFMVEDDVMQHICLDDSWAGSAIHFRAFERTDKFRVMEDAHPLPASGVRSPWTRSLMVCSHFLHK